MGKISDDLPDLIVTTLYSSTSLVIRSSLTAKYHFRTELYHPDEKRAAGGGFGAPFHLSLLFCYLYVNVVNAIVMPIKKLSFSVNVCHLVTIRPFPLFPIKSYTLILAFLQS